MQTLANPIETYGLCPFSRAERDRRYGLVQAAMRQRGLAALVVFASNNMFDYYNADARYLTQLGGNFADLVVVLSGAPEATVVIREGGRVEFWQRIQDWVSDIRSGQYGNWSRVVAEAVRDHLGTPGRVGIVGLRNLTRSPEGFVPYETVVRLERALPGYELVDASDLVEPIRRVKSAEEQAVLRKAAQVVAAGIQAMDDVARPGVTDRQVWAEVIYRQMLAGGDPDSLYFWRAAEAPLRTGPVPTFRPLAVGDIVLNEFDGKYAGYGVQAIHPLSIGRPLPIYQRLSEVAEAAFQQVVAAAKPGASFGDLWRAGAAAVQGSGFEFQHPLFHGMGLGEDGPIDLPTSDLTALDAQPIQAGMALMIQPCVAQLSADPPRLLTVGKTILVGESGSAPLLDTPVGLKTIPA